jgi:hypothetical protein
MRFKTNQLEFDGREAGSRRSPFNTFPVSGQPPPYYEPVVGLFRFRVVFCSTKGDNLHKTDEPATFAVFDIHVRIQLVRKIPMIQHKSDLELADEEIPALAEQAVREAYLRAIAEEEGLLELDSKTGIIHRVFADGRKIVVKTIAPSISTKIGAKIPIS